MAFKSPDKNETIAALEKALSQLNGVADFDLPHATRKKLINSACATLIDILVRLRRHANKDT